MREVPELEQIVNAVSTRAADSAYTTLEEFERGNIEKDAAYQEILEMIVYDILKTPKK